VDLGNATPAQFLTRWVTHFCAPTFVLLAGAGAFLFGHRGHTKRELAWFLLSRGLWLVLLDLTVVRLGWTFNLDYAQDFDGDIVWAIGWSMVGLSGLVFLPLPAVAAIGVAIIGLHNCLDWVKPTDLHCPSAVWTLLHEPGDFRLLPPFSIGPVHVPEIHFGTRYSLLPWLGVMAAGYGFAPLLLQERSRRRKLLLALGLGLILLFVGLRWLNVYGDPSGPNPSGPGQWSPQESGLFTLLSFINCQKYPPSLLFILMTLGPAITALALLDRPAGRLGRFFITYGRVPLFFYLLHIPLVHGLAVLTDLIRFGWSPYAYSGLGFATEQSLPAHYGASLPVVYLIWAGVVLLLYWPCRWFADVKRRRRSFWLSYL
jgi:uncharacterized membrane protein